MKVANYLVLALLSSSCSFVTNKPFRAVAQEKVGQENESEESRLYQIRKPLAASAAEFRAQTFEQMLSEDNFMTKMDLAAKFANSFEFQFASLTGPDGQTARKESEQIRLEAIQEISHRLKPMYQKLKPEMKGNEISEDYRNFYAIALTLHRKSAKQANPESLLEFIQQGLSKKETADSELRPFEAEVLKNESLFLRLLEARHKVIPLVVINMLSEKDLSLNRRLDLVLMTWKPSSDISLLKIEFSKLAIDMAIEAKKNLADLNFNSKLDHHTKKMLKNLDLSQDDNFKELGLSITELLSLDQ